MYSVVVAVPLLIASALAQSPSTTTTVPYSNPFTSLTTQTDSRGVITGQPTAETSQPPVVTSQPQPSSIPAGLSSGVYTIPYGNNTSFTVSVGGNSTVVLSSSSTTSAPSGSGTAGGSGGGSGGGAKTTSATNLANGVRVAGGSLAGAAAFIAAFL